MLSLEDWLCSVVFKLMVIQSCTDDSLTLMFQIAAASRVQGVTPATIVCLLKHVKQSFHGDSLYDAQFLIM